MSKPIFGDLVSRNQLIEAHKEQSRERKKIDAAKQALRLFKGRPYYRCAPPCWLLPWEEGHTWACGSLVKLWAEGLRRHGHEVLVKAYRENCGRGGKDGMVGN